MVCVGCGGGKGEKSERSDEVERRVVQPCGSIQKSQEWGVGKDEVEG